MQTSAEYAYSLGNAAAAAATSRYTVLHKLCLCLHFFVY